MIYGVIYLLINTITGKMYVGQTTNLKKRIAEHKRGDQYVDRAIRKYGWKNFRCFVIKNCASKAEMDTWEKFFIILLNTKSPNGYNLTDGGEYGQKTFAYISRDNVEGSYGQNAFA